MKKFNWSNVEATSDNYATPPAGGYVLCICEVEDVPAKEYLKVFYDIIGVADPANAQFEGYYGKRLDRSNGKIPLPYFIRSYKQSAMGFFKAFLVALEKSNNNGFSADNFDSNEAQFQGMCVGAVLAQEEYPYDGKLRVRLKVDTLCSVERITSGDFKIPECKKYEGDVPAQPAAPANSGSFGHNVPVNDDELPF